MDRTNGTRISVFWIVGFSDIPKMQLPLFLVVLLTYLVTILGNLSILAIIIMDLHLHKPMYYLLSNLSLFDICYTSVVLPSALGSFFKGALTFPFDGCLTQLYFFFSFFGTELFLLTAMSYDRYVAVCNPLRYAATMSDKMCFCLAAGSWVAGFLNAIGLTASMSNIPFCGPNVVNHFFCDLTPLLQLSCRDPWSIQVLVFVEGVFTGMSSFLLSLTSYVCIICTILKISSRKGRWKSFSKCASHLAVVLIFYGTGICMYMRPASFANPNQDKLLAILYISLTPMANPLIYSLRNKDVQESLLKAMRERAQDSWG